MSDTPRCDYLHYELQGRTLEHALEEYIKLAKELETSNRQLEATNNEMSKITAELEAVGPEVGALAGWISMKERRPADFERVLCVNGAGYMTTANRFHMAGGSGEDWNGSDYTAEEAVECVIGGITHWMPLPAFPSPQKTT